MKIAVVQLKSQKGDVERNIEHHARMIQLAAGFQTDLIVFPELSITNYEPTLAQELAKTAKDEIFQPLQALADANDMFIGVGCPLRSGGMESTIGMIIFQPGAEPITYSKRLLHDDEVPFFIPGKGEPHFKIKGKRITLGICYETLQKEHFDMARQNQSELFIASVAKPDRGVRNAFVNFTIMAKSMGMPILMSNSIGPSDDFISDGQSAIWNKNGELIAKLDQTSEGLLIYDSENNTVDTHVMQDVE
ncbi:carbon-nitrogen hydrolase family protein [Roseivirga sp.]|uniref:carbon-nitrogen hydrolase family protein n=1 Tax=Roseivirga sp. TaxID=1964215 RepID=UPI003B52979F